MQVQGLHYEMSFVSSFRNVDKLLERNHVLIFFFILQQYLEVRVT